MSKTVIFAIVFVSLFGAVQAQKGAKSISIGPVISFPLRTYAYSRQLPTGVGLEAIGQYNFSNRSAALLQIDYTSHRRFRMKIFSLAGGYRYQFGSSGLFANILAGISKISFDNYGSYVNDLLTLGAGKRFIIFNDYFIDAGIEYGGGDGETRLNIKATFSLLHWSK